MADKKGTKGQLYGLCFLVGGIYGVIGQLIGTALEGVVGPAYAAPLTLLCLGVLAVALYVPGIHQRIAVVSGFGSILPFNGFACGNADAFQAGFANGGGWRGGLKGVAKLFFHVIVLSSIVNMIAGCIAAALPFGFSVSIGFSMPGAILASFVVAGIVCIAFQAITDAGQFKVPNVLLVGQSLGGVLSLVGFTDVLASLGGYGFKVLVMGAGQAVEKSTALCFSQGLEQLLITWGTFFALAGFGILSGWLNLRLKGEAK